MSIEERIAEILWEHRPGVYEVAHCECGYPTGDDDDWSEHTAAVLVRELPLTPEYGLTDWSTATRHKCTCGMDDIVDEWHSCERGQHGDESYPVVRHVTAWEPADTGAKGVK